MTFYESARTGASASQKAANKTPIGILRDLRDRDRTGDAAHIFQTWLEKIERDDDLRHDALHHTFTNLWTTLERDEIRAKPKSKSNNNDANKAAADDLVVRVQTIIRMNLMLPIGKLLRDATFKECAQAGGWFGKVAKKGKPAQIVGKVLSEEQLQAIKL